MTQQEFIETVNTQLAPIYSPESTTEPATTDETGCEGLCSDITIHGVVFLGKFAGEAQQFIDRVPYDTYPLPEKDSGRYLYIPIDPDSTRNDCDLVMTVYPEHDTYLVRVDPTQVSFAEVGDAMVRELNAATITTDSVLSTLQLEKFSAVATVQTPESTEKLQSIVQNLPESSKAIESATYDEEVLGPSVRCNYEHGVAVLLPSGKVVFHDAKCPEQTAQVYSTLCNQIT